MREMIFNDASVLAPARSIYDVAPLLADLARGMAQLVNRKNVGAVLRMRRPLYELQCANDGNLYDALRLLQSNHDGRDVSLFLMKLSQKAPLLVDLPLDVVDRFRGCEAAAPNAKDCEALVLCAHIGAVAISIPLDARWDVDQLEIQFVELLPDASFANESEKIDNVARAIHARSIIDRGRIVALDNLTTETLWKLRGDVFPHLKFGLDVEDQIRRVNSSHFMTLVRRIHELHAAAEEWSRLGGPSPRWRCKVTPESASTMANAALRNARNFRDADGNVRNYALHARFGSAFRIHIRLIGETRDVEIGYVGGHLPLH